MHEDKEFIDSYIEMRNLEPISNRIKQENSTISRNDPCKCGSGKKYKKCCLKHIKKGEQEERQFKMQEHVIEEALKRGLINMEDINEWSSEEVNDLGSAV